MAEFETRATHVNNSLVPLSFTIGLAVFSVILALAGYGFRLAFGEPFAQVLQHAIKVVPFFVVGIPFFFLGASLFLNRYQGMNIQARNALTLGWLTSCVAMLWLMGTYS